jgi:metallo-beta-lactamase class B
MRRTIRLIVFVILFFAVTPLAVSQPATLHAKITKLTDKVYIHTTYKRLGTDPFPSNGLILNTDAGVVLIDTGWDIPQTEEVLQWVKSNLQKPVVRCIVTHSHEDRVGGVSVLNAAGIQTLGTSLTAEKAKASGVIGVQGVLPRDSVLNIGGCSIETYFAGRGHTEDNIVVWLSGERVLFGGCLVKSVDAEDLGYTKDAYLSDWKTTIEHLMKKFPDAAYIIPGHQAWTSKDALKHTVELLESKNH